MAAEGRAPVRALSAAVREIPGFRWFRAGERRLLVAEPLARAALRLGLLDAGGAERLLGAGGGRRGRGRTAVVALPGREGRLHLRPVRHGGALAPLWRGRLLGLRRPLAELEVNVRLAAAGAPVPMPALVAGRRWAGPLWTAALGTLYEEDTFDGVGFLATRPGRARAVRAAAAAGDAIRRFHGAGGRHPDLHLKNLLLRERGAEIRVLVVDLDGARMVERTDPRARMAELMRLYRSLVKTGLLDAVGPRGLARFLGAYTGGDRALRRALLAQLPRERRRLALHRLGYRRRSRERRS